MRNESSDMPIFRKQIEKELLAKTGGQQENEKRVITEGTRRTGLTKSERSDK